MGLGGTRRLPASRANQARESPPLDVLDYGCGAAWRLRRKVRVAPVQSFADRVEQRALDLTSAEQVFRPALVAELRERPYEFDVQVSSAQI